VLEFCLFLVVFPARCISSVSPRFYFRKHSFCFLPLVTILESPFSIFLFSLCVNLLYIKDREMNETQVSNSSPQAPSKVNSLVIEPDKKRTMIPQRDKNDSI
jgi:hypothetical protein